MKSIDEIHRDLPDGADPSPKPPRPSTPPSCCPFGYVLLAALLVLLWVALAMPAVTCGWGRLAEARDGTTRHLIDQLSQAAKAYELDYAVYPLGNGDGSKELASCLGQKGPKGKAYFDFTLDMLSDGNVLGASGGIIHYRCPGVHNPSSFDLWTEDRHGRPDGLNNWE